MKSTFMANIAKVASMSAKAKAITAAAVVVVGTAAGGTTYAVVQHNKAEKAEALANQYQVQIIDGQKTVVDKDGKAAKDLSLDKDGNIVDANNKVIVAVDRVKHTTAKKDPAKKEPPKKEAGQTADIKKDADAEKPADSAEPSEDEDKDTKPESGSAAVPAPPKRDENWDHGTESEAPTREPTDTSGSPDINYAPEPEPEPEPEPSAPVTIITKVYEYGGVCYKPSRENATNWMVFDDRTQEEQAAHPLTLWLLGENGEGGVHCEFVSMSGEFVSYDIVENGACVELFEDGTHQYGEPGGLQ